MDRRWRNNEFNIKATPSPRVWGVKLDTERSLLLASTDDGTSIAVFPSPGECDVDGHSTIQVESGLYTPYQTPSYGKSRSLTREGSLLDTFGGGGLEAYCPLF